MKLLWIILYLRNYLIQAIPDVNLKNIVKP